MDDRYPPIEDHGVIGNLRSAALVALDGTIDWCCLPDLDSPSVFASLLDRERGGRFVVSAEPRGRRSQRYVEDTNILETIFEGNGSRLTVTDFMPLSGALEGCGGSRTEPAIYRVLRAEGGPVQVRLEWAPRFDYARSAPQLIPSEGGFLAWSGSSRLGLWGTPPEARMAGDRYGPKVEARFRMEPGDRRALVTRWGTHEPVLAIDEIHERLDETTRAWRGWSQLHAAGRDRAWAGPYRKVVARSELTLKLLTHADTGAIAAAATTSLPEEVGGVRNWDYRFTWIRDAALVAQALFALGHREDARAFIEWVERSARDEDASTTQLQLVYGLRGQADLDEKELSNLEGYRRSAPVRIGNEAVNQLQLDIYGELISAAYEFVRMGGELDRKVLDFLPGIADQACGAWRQPDFGIWEFRNGPFHFVYSKAMVWMALDRALRMAERGVIEGDTERWKKERKAVREQVLKEGFDAELGAFKQSYERSTPDASNLLLPLLEFLPFDDPRVQKTLDRTLEMLVENDLVYRYRADDGVAGSEGAFGLCTFWLADALSMSGRLDEAEKVFEGMVSRVNHLGLYSEQIDPSSGAFLGNFPQAFTHLGLVNSCLYLAHAKGLETPIPHLIGSSAHRRDSDEEEST